MKLKQATLDNMMELLLIGSVLSIMAGMFLYSSSHPLAETLGVALLGAGVCGIVSLLGTVAILMLAHSLGEARQSNEAARKLYERKDME